MAVQYKFFSSPIPFAESIGHIVSIPLSQLKADVASLPLTSLVAMVHPMGYGGAIKIDVVAVGLNASLKINHLNVSLGKTIINHLPVVFNDVQYKFACYPLPMNDLITKFFSHSIPLAVYAPLQTKFFLHSIPLDTNPIINHSIDVSIFLDDRNITHLLSAATIIFDAENPHNTIELTGLAPQLFYYARALVGAGVQIEVITDSQSEYFYLEDLEGSISNFRLWGRSLSAAYSADSTVDDISIDTLVLASDVAKLGLPALTWEAEDWQFDQQSFSGSPIAIAKEIAEACGAVVRCKIDGSVYVRQFYQVRPVDMQTSPYTLKINQSDILSISKTNETGNGYDQIDVYGPAYDELLYDPDVVVETEPVPTVEGDVYVRAYFPSAAPPDIAAAVTAGDIAEVATGTETIEEEQISFEGGYGTATYPIKEVVSFSWIGFNSESITTVPYSRTLSSGKTWGVGLLTYKSEYLRFRIYNHAVNYIRGRLTIPVGPDVSIRGIIGDGGSQNPSSINDDLIRSKAVATKRAEYIFDSEYYDRENISLTVPVTSANKTLVDGDLILIYAPIEGVACIAMVKRITREYTEKQVMKIEAERCLVS